jgi:hypothetical protein
VRDIRAEKDTVAAIAADIRHHAIQQRYAGGPPPETAFGLASILDMLHLHWVDLDEPLRDAVLALHPADE